jgi:putative transposase
MGRGASASGKPPTLESVPRPPRICFPGALYHVTARGNDRAAVVRDNTDRRALLGLLAEVIRNLRWRCHAYCLMDNHYHLVIETPEPNLSAGMQRLNGTYAQRFNQRHKRSGHLFQGRFHTALLDRESHLLETCRYVVLNPVRAGVCAEPVAWPWSSYRATAGFSARPSFLTLSWIHSPFGRDTSTAIRAYRAFVDHGS